MISKISGDAGHNCYPDTGANGYRLEDQLTKETWGLVQSKLQGLGITTVDCTPYGQSFNSVSGSLAYRVKLANNSGSQLHLCIHYNSGGGHGVECWISQTGGNSEKYAKAICKDVADLGFANRGVKVGNLYVPKYTTMPCVLIEVAFVDSQSDMNKINCNQVATAIVKAVTGQLVEGGSDASPALPTPPPPTSTGSIKANARIVKDWLYIRDSSGSIIKGGKVFIGDEVEVLDVLYSKQLVLMKYPTPNGPRTEYTSNAVNCIEYFYGGEWHNGSTTESVFEDSSCSRRIGSLSPYETATPLFRRSGHLHVVYATDKGNSTKSGFVRYNGGFNKF